MILKLTFTIKFITSFIVNTTTNIDATKSPSIRFSTINILIQDPKALNGNTKSPSYLRQGFEILTIVYITFTTSAFVLFFAKYPL